MILTIHLLNPQIILCSMFTKTLICFFLSTERRRFVSQKHKIRSSIYFNGGFSDGQGEDYEQEGSERAPN
jgi:hypothetical protein